ncbi:hypothetical protein BX600DRAFT_536141 [Xylariales sp. PMI_506]|nr:hypothetical protein BX600DRAFT_536141 [Xylariales sp. PMI_506]
MRFILLHFNCVVDTHDSTENTELIANPSPPTLENGIVAVLFVSVPDMSDESLPLTRVGYDYTTVWEDEVNSWEFRTCCIQNPTSKFKPGDVRWTTPKFGYDDRVHHMWKFPGPTVLAGIDVQHIWASPMRSSGNLPLLLATIGHHAHKELIFLDIWPVPRFIAKKLEPNWHRGKGAAVEILCQVRLAVNENSGCSTKWYGLQMNHDIVPRATCQLGDNLEAVFTLLDDEVQMSIFRRKQGAGELENSVTVTDLAAILSGLNL